MAFDDPGRQSLWHAKFKVANIKDSAERLNMNTLHLLRSEPDETVRALIEALGHDNGATVVSLYPDAIANTPVDWQRLIDDIFIHERVICWW